MTTQSLRKSVLDLGHRIDQDMKQTINNFGDYDRLGALRDKAYEVGLENKEKALKSDDAFLAARRAPTA